MSTADTQDCSPLDFLIITLSFNVHIGQSTRFKPAIIIPLIDNKRVFSRPALDAKYYERTSEINETDLTLQSQC